MKSSLETPLGYPLLPSKSCNDTRFGCVVNKALHGHKKHTRLRVTSHDKHRLVDEKLIDT